MTESASTLLHQWSDGHARALCIGRLGTKSGAIDVIDAVIKRSPGHPSNDCFHSGAQSQGENHGRPRRIGDLETRWHVHCPRGERTCIMPSARGYACLERATSIPSCVHCAGGRQHCHGAPMWESRDHTAGWRVRSARGRLELRSQVELCLACRRLNPEKTRMGHLLGA